METPKVNSIALIHAKEYEITDKNERIVMVEAPGRIHLMGEHCKPGAGIYLSAAVDRVVQVAVSARKDNSLRFFTARSCERKRTTIANIHYKREDRWANHIKPAICLFSEMGYPLRGLNWTITSTVPQNSSLAAAESIEIAATFALKRYYKCQISDKELLLKLNELHREFYPEEDAMIDYLIMLNAKKDSFLIIDEANLEVTRIKSPFPRYKMLLVDSKVPFIGVEDELRARLAELDRGLDILAKKRQVKSFKEIVGTDMIELIGDLNEGVRRRCMHAVRELDRIAESGRALIDGDLPVIARSFFHSHESLRDLYEVTCPELDWLVKRAQETDGCLGARMTGNGFGGCVFVILPSSKVGEYLSKMEEYERIFGFHPIHHEIRPGGGLRYVKG